MVVKTPEPIRIAIVLGPDGCLHAAGVVRGDVGEGAKLLEALNEPLRQFVDAAKRQAARLTNQSKKRTYGLRVRPGDPGRP